MRSGRSSASTANQVFLEVTAPQWEQGQSATRIWETVTLGSDSSPWTSARYAHDLRRSYALPAALRMPTAQSKVAAKDTQTDRQRATDDGAGKGMVVMGERRSENSATTAENTRKIATTTTVAVRPEAAAVRARVPHTGVSLSQPMPLRREKPISIARLECRNGPSAHSPP